ncbi:DUF4262 domain-containing protein [Georgenia sp. H159]|uniref:DUF4262 domain-containing protein n=1 Tax=Georgenia sp. H159 TaxID=3076115 RepID=UPI002D78767C|nr:DUF4262 domain-containing protein [Georgenia sp. H159]
MCLICDGWTWEEVLARHREVIEQHGWTIQFVEGHPGRPSFAYTVGLTRFHDHPELLVSGTCERDAAVVLDPLAQHVRDGHRFTAGDVIASVSPHRYRLVRVNDPRHLAVAQLVYGQRGATPVPGLQVVWSNHDGQWPWDPAWADGRRRQPLFGHTRWPGRR